LEAAIGRVDRLVTNDEEALKVMLDRKAWLSRIKMIVAANKYINSTKREDSKVDAVKLEVLLTIFSII
jgi:hypothetical protein